MHLRVILPGWFMLFTAVLGFRPVVGEELTKVPRYNVHEVTFLGPHVKQTDTPARDIELMVRFRHESGSPTIQVFGFWDGNGQGATQGNVFKVRFCPTQIGRWMIVGTLSNVAELRGQREGEGLVCTPSLHPGFWLADGRYYKRSDGSHQYIVGNTHYSFLSRQTFDGPAKSEPVIDIRANAQFYKKLRFTLFGDRYPDPNLKPFLDGMGEPTDDGQYSLRPNPVWFIQRVDPVVREGFAQDLICDLILCGPDTQESRASLKSDPKPWLRYIAARYGAYPNVWICLANEWDIKKPCYSAAEVLAAGEAMRSFLPYLTPISVHGAPEEWNESLNNMWHDHTIIQYKIRQMPDAADCIINNWQRGGEKPVINDENAYQGEGDRFSEPDVIEGCFGTFMGGGYPTTGEKYGKKLGQYFWGGFDAKAHSASDNLNYLRAYVDNHVEFWRLVPVLLAKSLFSAAPSRFRLLANDGQEYVLGSNSRAEDIHVELPAGYWIIRQIDLFVMTTKTLGENVSGGFTFETPDSRAVATHFRRVDRQLAPGR